MIDEPYVGHNMRLLDEVCLIPFRRELHEIDGMVEEIVRQSKAVSPLVPVGGCAVHPRESTLGSAPSGTSGHQLKLWLLCPQTSRTCLLKSSRIHTMAASVLVASAVSWF